MLLKKIIIFIKPSNFKSLVSNKIKQGKLISEIEFYFDKIFEIQKDNNGNLKIDPRNNFNTNIKFNRISLRSNINVNLTETTEVALKFNGNFLIFSILCLLGSIYTANIIPNKQNPIIVNTPNVNANPVIVVVNFFIVLYIIRQLQYRHVS